MIGWLTNRIPVVWLRAEIRDMKPPNLAADPRTRTGLAAGWPTVNGVTVKYLQNAPGCAPVPEPNFALWVKREDRYMLWDRAWASSLQAAQDYFRGRYPTEERRVLPIRRKGKPKCAKAKRT